MRRLLTVLALVSGIALTSVCSQAQNADSRLEFDRKGETIVLAELSTGQLAYGRPSGGALAGARWTNSDRKA